MDTNEKISLAMVTVGFSLFLFALGYGVLIPVVLIIATRVVLAF